jgi:hypothetical protein
MGKLMNGEDKEWECFLIIGEVSFRRIVRVSRRKTRLIEMDFWEGYLDSTWRKNDEAPYACSDYRADERRIVMTLKF